MMNIMILLIKLTLWQANNNNNQNAITDDIIKICEYTTFIADTYCDKTKYIKDNEQISVSNTSMSRFCYKQVERNTK